MNDYSKRIKKTENNPIIDVIRVIQQLIAGFGLTGLSLGIFIKGKNSVTRMSILPFLALNVIILINSIINAAKIIIMRRSAKSKNEEALQTAGYIMGSAQRSLNKLYIIVFLFFWFAILILFDYLAWQQGGNDGLRIILFSAIFWIIGIYVGYKKLR